MTNATPDRTQINLLLPFESLGLNCIVVPSTAKEFASAVDEIKAEKVVGFDTESKPVFATGVVNHGPHIVQFATRTKAFIFQLYRPECLPFLLEVLQSKDILKVGFALKSDQGHLHNKLGVQLRSVLDLNTVFHVDGYIREVGVKTAVAIVFNKKFHKSKKRNDLELGSAQAYRKATAIRSKRCLGSANGAFSAQPTLQRPTYHRTDLVVRKPSNSVYSEAQRFQ